MSTMAAARLRESVERARADALERALTRAFWHAVQGEPLPVMAALEAAARAVGALYRQNAASHAAAHGEGACGCGWRPDPESDLIVLEAMLAAAARETPRRDLATMPPAGRA